MTTATVVGDFRVTTDTLLTPIELGEIVVFVDGQTETAGILESAGALAEEHDAHLTGVFMQPLPASTAPQMFARGKGILNVIDAQRAQLEGIEADHRALFEDTVRRHGVRSEWRSVPYFSGEVEVHAHYADLALVARPDPAGQTAGPPGLVESLVLTSGRPVIVLPPHAPPGGSRTGAGGGYRALPGASRRASGGTTPVVRR